MRTTLVVVLSVMFTAGLCGMVVAGSVDTPGIPSAGSGMYTLQNLYDYLTSGTALTVQSSFQEPTSAPGSTMKTTREIGDAVQALFTQCPVTVANVESGVKFFSTQPGSWGPRTGTMVKMVPCRSSANFAYSACYSGERAFYFYPTHFGYPLNVSGGEGPSVKWCQCLGHAGGAIAFTDQGSQDYASKALVTSCNAVNLVTKKYYPAIIMCWD